MLTHKDIEVKCSEEQARQVIGLVRSQISLIAGWRIEEDWVRATVDPASCYADGLFTIVGKVLDGKTAFGVVLCYDVDKGEFTVPNIVPTIRDELSVAEYNSCFDEFWTLVGRKVFKGLKVKRLGGEVDCEKLLSPELRKLFNSFSMMANRKSLHPYDERRWRTFVIRMASARRRLDQRQIRCLFVEFGWDADSAKRMAERYSYEIAILRQYKGCRN